MFGIRLILLLCLITLGLSDKQDSPCYDANGHPQPCMPPFENLAFGKPVSATNTCGIVKPQEYCIHGSGRRYICQTCDSSKNETSHGSEFITDSKAWGSESTWWQSETLLDGVPDKVNLTLNLGGACDITYINLKFMSSRPDSMAIYKRTNPGDPLTAYQYFSAFCEGTYGVEPDQTIFDPADQTKALCTGKYSDIIPLSGGQVVFSTLAGRPDAFRFEESPDLQEWITSSEIKITLDRINTFGDESFGEPEVLKSYFYAISNIDVAGRHKCNGHAAEYYQEPGEPERYSCRCEHNAAGANCERCGDLYNDRPWGRATADDAHECKACQCNGHAHRCHFDQEVYEASGYQSGGVCDNCLDNTRGKNCELCLSSFYKDSNGVCTFCNCDLLVSTGDCADITGQCECQPKYSGLKCDRCSAGYYDWPMCKTCDCHTTGSSSDRCDPVTGQCSCKPGYKGRRCDSCEAGHSGFPDCQKEHEQ